MIRVAYDVSAAAAYPGLPAPATGVARVIREVLVRLALKASLQVSVVGAFGGDWNPISTSLKAEAWVRNANRCEIGTLRSFRSRTGLSKALAHWLLRMETECAVSGRGRPSPWRLRVLQRILRFDAIPSIPQGEIDSFCATFLAPPAFLPPELPRVVFIHDVIPRRLPEECGPTPQAMLQAVLESLNPSRDVVVAVSNFTKEDFCCLTGFPSNRVVVAPLAAAAHFQPSNPAAIERMRVRYGIGPDPYLLSVANPQPRKNLAGAVRAFGRLVKALPNWRGNFVLAGHDSAGWGVAELEAVISEDAELSARIKRIGAVAEDDLSALYCGCVGFVFPSLYEGFGLPVLEAMQCGAPVICSNSTSLPEVAGDAALLVDSTNGSDITSAMVGLVSDPNLAKQLSARGLERARAFSWERTADCVEEAFLLALRPSAIAS